MKFRVGACAMLVCLAGCTAEAPNTKFGDQRGATSTNARTAQRLPYVQVGRETAQSVANAPDRGELMSYKNKGVATKREGAYTWYPIAVSEAHALKAVVDGVMTIPSPDGSQVKIRYERHIEHPDGNWTWIGRVIGGDQQQEAILTFGEKAVFGSIPQKTGAPLNLQTRAGSLYAVQTDLSKVKNPNSGADMMVPPALALRSALLASASKAQVSQSSAETKAATAGSTVDVAIGYTPGLTSLYGSQSGAVTRLVNLVDIGNQAFTNSLVNGALRIVNAVQVNYTDGTTNKAALGELTGNNGEATVPVPASLAPLRTARDQYGADLAVLVRRFQTPENDGCGIAWLNGSGQTPINPATDDDYGFAVISDGNDTGTDGNSYFCAAETLVHEIGHLMGSAHDRDNSRINPAQPPGGTNLLYGRYPYSFGMKTTAASGNFYTIMAYGDDGQVFYRTFSNPLVLKCGPNANLACGVANQTDNARSLNQTIPVVATFRAAVVPLAAKPRHDVNGDSRTDLLWRNTAGRLSYWEMSGATISFSSPSIAQATNYKLVGTGDFTGDGRSDLVWQSSANVVLWTASAAAHPVFTPTVISATPAGWSIVGAADVDGDGKSDLLWRNTSSGNIAHWLMNGAVVRSQSASRAMLPSYKLVAIGDLNGDGRADLMFDNNTWLYAWINNGSGAFTQRSVGAHPAGWSILDSGDITGDGRSDLIWRNTSTGNFSYWAMNGAAVTSKSVSIAMPLSYKLSTVGDLNGDGRVDLVWDNNVAVWAWLTPPTGTTFVQTRIGNHPAGWTLQDPMSY
jgi:peptidyl-Asp metalloendopeptidase